MTEGDGPYLVSKREDGYGDVHSLQPGQRFTLGRAHTNRIVIKDELCSREHAEIYFAEGRWFLRNLKSLNGTRVNGSAITEWELSPGDLVQLGRMEHCLRPALEELPESTELDQPVGETVAIKKRLGQTRFFTPWPSEAGDDSTATGDPPKRSLSRDLSLLYRLALDMASANSYDDLVRVVLDGLLEAVPAAEVGAILTMKEGRELEVTCHRHRDPSIQTYAPVSEFVTNEVMASREAILAEDVARDRYLRNARASGTWARPASSAPRSSSTTRSWASSTFTAPIRTRRWAGRPGIHRRRRQAARPSSPTRCSARIR